MQRLSIQADADDGELETTGVFGDAGFAPQGERNGWTYMGGYDASELPGEGLTSSYFRFALEAALPAGSTIEGARLRLFATDEWNWDAADYVSIALEDTSDAAVVSGMADIPFSPSGRPLTAAVRWPEAGSLEWILDAWHETSDLAPLLQDLVDRYGGLEAGAHVQVFVYRAGGETNGEIAAEDFSNPASNHAELVVEWR